MDIKKNIFELQGEELRAEIISRKTKLLQTIDNLKTAVNKLQEKIDEYTEKINSGKGNKFIQQNLSKLLAQKENLGDLLKRSVQEAIKLNRARKEAGFTGGNGTTDINELANELKNVVQLYVLEEDGDEEIEGSDYEMIQYSNVIDGIIDEINKTLKSLQETQVAGKRKQNRTIRKHKNNKGNNLKNHKKKYTNKNRSIRKK